jgi:hypothetical protein
VIHMKNNGIAAKAAASVVMAAILAAMAKKK